MKKFNRPNFQVLSEDKSLHFAKFLAEPLERGFGNTLGNAIRRTLLSSTPGAAVYGVRIKGAAHEFAFIDGIVENITRIILNIKNLVFKIDEDIIGENERVVITFESNKEGVVTGNDLVCPSGVEVISKDNKIATISKGGELKLELFAKNNRGYKSVNDNKIEKEFTDVIIIDSNYSPIEKVSYEVAPTKVGKNEELEKLEISVQTNGSIEPAEAISISSKIIYDHLELFINLNENLKEEKLISEEVKKEIDELDKSIDLLDFTQRSQNCLKRARIETLRDLVSKTEQEIHGIRNLGKKSLQEIKDKVAELNLEFKSY